MKIFLIFFCIIFAGFILQNCNKSSDEQPGLPEKSMSNTNTNSKTGITSTNNNVSQDLKPGSTTGINNSSNNTIPETQKNIPDNVTNGKPKILKYSDSKEVSLPGNPLKPDKLKNFLPEKIPGTTRTIPSTGINMNDDNQTVTNVSATYSFKTGGIKISIHDYGRYEYIPNYDKKYFISPPTEPGYESEIIQSGEGKGYSLWDPGTNSGKLYYLLANRIIINMDAYSLPKESNGLVQYLYMIQIKNLINELSR